MQKLKLAIKVCRAKYRQVFQSYLNSIFLPLIKYIILLHLFYSQNTLLKFLIQLLCSQKYKSYLNIFIKLSLNFWSLFRTVCWPSLQKDNLNLYQSVFFFQCRFDKRLCLLNQVNFLFIPFYLLFGSCNRREWHAV